MLARFATLHVMLAAAVTAAAFNGILDKFLNGEGRWFIAALVAAAGYGLWSILRGRADTASWVATMLLPIAVVGMQIGLIVGLDAMGKVMIAGGDSSKAVGGFLSAVSVAFHVSVAAFLSYLWLNLVLKVTGHDRG